ncbi:hypothetical protein AK88_04150 [Plasmodium fragile]|uniref:Uncharacterized protein n=1 Tax=Plasmodium fragile TaxID=5857 RepID=A0A0D9QGQ1_PLAFR|nr:uncharacterized protein AK88_04150 [Plasmodium fragile]KJP86179.1 hypothetical protein AK88_04150 [Plasmodium fragile]
MRVQVPVSFFSVCNNKNFDMNNNNNTRKIGTSIYYIIHVSLRIVNSLFFFNLSIIFLKGEFLISLSVVLREKRDLYDFVYFLNTRIHSNMLQSNNKQTSTSNGVSQGASQCRNDKAYFADNEEGETDGIRAHRWLFSRRVPIILFFVVACICLTHTDDFNTQEQPLAKVHNRVARSLAKVKSLSSENGLELHPMAFEHYDGAYDDVEQPYEEDYACSPKRIYSDAQWEDEEDGTILKAWKMVEYQVPQQVHYERKWKIEHDAREKKVHKGDNLSAAMAVAEAVATSRTSVSKVGSGSSLPPSPQNAKQSAKTKQESKGPSDTGRSGSTGSTASTASIGSTMNGRQNEVVNIKTGRDFSRRKLAKYIIYRWNGYTQYVLTSDIPVLLPKAKAKVPKKVVKDQNCIKTRAQTRGTPDKSRDTPRNRKQLTKHNFLYCTSG